MQEDGEYQGRGRSEVRFEFYTSNFFPKILFQKEGRGNGLMLFLIRIGGNFAYLLAYS